MNQLINIENYNIKEYKTEIESFYKNLKQLIVEVINLNDKIPYLESYIKQSNKDIINEIDLKDNKKILDTISLEFKNIENYNVIIKKQLNNWKSVFAGQNGLDTLIKNKKEELLLPVKQKQIAYDNQIKETKTLKEQSKTKTILGLRQYTTYKILSIDADILDKEYWIINESAILIALKSGIEVKGVTFEVIKEYK
ncbi:hypothetical protein [Spiroplasma endosymbiont of Polydrusus pterygomalis]|uniref:hypothetical protein n=1 Tax=Spiroplasma endosymbiont of Polydrusus pterygomalis TaxID=3139327 RepID=UPI003CCB0D0E